MSDQRSVRVAIAEIGKIAPLPIAQIGFVWPWPITAHERLRGSQIALVECAIRQVHIRNVATDLELQRFSFRSTPLDQDAHQSERADENQSNGGCRQRRFAPTPAHTPRHRSCRPGLRGFVPEKSLQVRGQFARAAVTLARRLPQALQAHRRQVHRHRRIQQPRRQRLLLQHLRQRLRRARPDKRRPAREQMEQQRPQPIHIRRRAHRPAAFGLLRRHVAGGSQNLPRQRQRTLLIHRPGQPEIRHVRLALGVEQDIRGFDIPMEHALLVRVLHRLGHFPTNSAARRGGNGPSRVNSARFVPSTKSIAK